MPKEYLTWLGAEPEMPLQWHQSGTKFYLNVMTIFLCVGSPLKNAVIAHNGRRKVAERTVVRRGWLVLQIQHPRGKDNLVQGILASEQYIQVFD